MLRQVFNNIKTSRCKCTDRSRQCSQAQSKRSPVRKIVYNVIPQPRYTASKNEREEFDSMFPYVVRDLTDFYKNVPEVQKHYIKVLNNSVPNHKQASGLLVVTAYKAFALPHDLTPNNIHLANILGWCANLFISFWNINDDIMDASNIRTGLPCWHKNDNVGLRAINDAIFLECSPYVLLRKHLSEHDSYLRAAELFHQVTLDTTMGQTLDTMCLINGRPRLHIFTMKRFELLARYKAAFLALIPTTLGMNLANRKDVNLHKQALSVLFELGTYFAVQNDILDCYGDPLITDKTSSDIREGKCTWLIVKALQKATQDQREILDQYYGRSDLESDLEIKRLYDDLNIFEEFLEFEKNSFIKLSRRIREMPDDFPKDFFFKLLDTFYGRGDSDLF